MNIEFKVTVDSTVGSTEQNKLHLINFVYEKDYKRMVVRERFYFPRL
jgi:hypothetical protein